MRLKRGQIEEDSVMRNIDFLRNANGVLRRG
ncbi:MAG: hypothetical protein Ta2G_21620 [Termitinemataceae bacterium]|nr:MAG: hypothetical protein Ta2G_21620 [Termitinemataceae bacterium]